MNPRERGFIVTIFSSSIVLFISILGASLLLRGLNHNYLTYRAQAQQRALFLGEASIDAAIDQLRGSNTADLPSTVLGGGTYWATLIDSAEDPNLTSAQYLLHGHGSAVSELRNVDVLVERVPFSIFQFALFGDETLTVSGSAITDSYDSSHGLYDPNTSGDNGDVGTNATGAGSVTVSGSIAINGQVAVGEGGDPNTVVDISGGSAIITGDPPLTTQGNNLTIPSVSTAGLDCSKSMTVNGGTKTLPADAPAGACTVSGDCCFTNLSVGGGATLTVSQPLQVYVTGAFSATGNSTTGVQTDPSSLILILTGLASSTIEGDLTGTSEFYGGIYAPNGTINIHGNAEIFGSVIAEDVNITGNAQVHYDEALQDVGPTGYYDVKVKVWRNL